MEITRIIYPFSKCAKAAWNLIFLNLRQLDSETAKLGM